MITLIKGDQGTGKTTRAKKIAEAKEAKSAACSVANLEHALTFMSHLNYLILDDLSAEEVKQAVDIYRSFDTLNKPKLILCTQDMSVSVVAAEEIKLHKIED